MGEEYVWDSWTTGRCVGYIPYSWFHKEETALINGPKEVLFFQDFGINREAVRNFVQAPAKDNHCPSKDWDERRRLTSILMPSKIGKGPLTWEEIERLQAKITIPESCPADTETQKGEVMSTAVSVMLQKKHSDYLDFYPDAKFSPWDDPPVGTLVLLGTRVCKVIGRNDAQFSEKPAHAPCPNCTCRAEDPLWGWWQVEFLDVKDGQGGAPLVSLEYPPRLQPLMPSEAHESAKRCP